MKREGLGNTLMRYCTLSHIKADYGAITVCEHQGHPSLYQFLKETVTFYLIYSVFIQSGLSHCTVYHIHL